jgi:hypothetical protein
VEAPPCPSEAEEKDLLESERPKAVGNLQKYQDETRSWRDPKVKKNDFDIGNLVLLQALTQRALARSCQNGKGHS